MTTESATVTIEPAFFGHHEADPRALLFFEWCQRTESGYQVAEFEEEVRELTHTGHPVPKACWRLLDRVEAAPRSTPRRFTEWVDAPDFVNELDLEGDSDLGLDTAALPDRILGGWLGRCVGSTLGKPLENGFRWTPHRIREYLESFGAYPLRDYVPVPDPLPPAAYGRRAWHNATLGRIDGVPRADDLDYTVLGLHLLEQHGPNFTPDQVAALWMERLPFLQTYTAERVAYRNLIDGFAPPDTATFRNPYREWVGGLIRADIHGYTNPGRPARAAESAARDVSISHVGNGSWAAMWAAALVSAAFTAPDPAAALTIAQQVTPPNSRLALALADVLDDHANGRTWEAATAAVHTRHAHYNWVHSIGNACLTAAGLLWGEGDFTRTLALAVQGGWDTDTNGATAGSVAGILTGAAAIPAHWTDPLHDTLHSAVGGYTPSSIEDLARRTVALVR